MSDGEERRRGEKRGKMKKRRTERSEKRKGQAGDEAEAQDENVIGCGGRF